MSGEEVEKTRGEFEKSNSYGPNPVTDIELLGDRYTRIQIATLLSYIRTAIKQNQQCDIKVSIGKNRNNVDFECLINNTKPDDLIAKETIEIN